MEIFSFFFWIFRELYVYLFFLFFWPCIFFGRSIPNRDWTHAPCAGNRVLTTGPPAAAAKLLQLWPTLFDPIDGSPPGSPGPGILQARTLEWVAIAFTNAWKWKVKVKSLSPVRLVATPWTARPLRPWDFPGESTGVGATDRQGSPCIYPFLKKAFVALCLAFWLLPYVFFSSYRVSQDW